MIEAKVCPVCGATFTPNPHARNQKYCSEECRYRNNFPVKNWSQDTLKWLRRRSFENMIHFYAPELRQVMEGSKPSKIFNAGVKNALYRHGVLVHDNRGRAGRRVFVSEKALRILEDDGI